MADVKTVDIDGSQWSMKDQVARDKIINLENILQTKANEIKAEIIGSGIRDFRTGSSYFSIPVTVPIGYKCLFTVVQWGHPSQLLINLSTPFNFKNNEVIYGTYTAFRDTMNEEVSIVGLLIKED